MSCSCGFLRLAQRKNRGAGGQGGGSGGRLHRAALREDRGQCQGKGTGAETTTGTTEARAAAAKVRVHAQPGLEGFLRARLLDELVVQQLRRHGAPADDLGHRQAHEVAQLWAGIQVMPLGVERVDLGQQQVEVHHGLSFNNERGEVEGVDLPDEGVNPRCRVGAPINEVHVEGVHPQCTLHHREANAPDIRLEDIIHGSEAVTSGNFWALVAKCPSIGQHASPTDRFANPKVGQLHSTFRVDEDVGGLDVTMQNVRFVQEDQSAENLAGNARQDVLGNKIGFDQNVAQSTHVHPFHQNLQVPIDEVGFFGGYNIAVLCPEDVRELLLQVLLGCQLFVYLDVLQSVGLLAVLHF
eukprot:RCo020453